jgi:signal transduction histidine kinase
MASSVAWLRATSSIASLPDDASASQKVLAEFERTTKPEGTVDIASRYAGRLDLLDPRLALPQWHKYPRDEAMRVHAATKHCPPLPAELKDAALAKAWAWHAQTCSVGAGAGAGAGSEGAAEREQIDRAPFIHPSGKSYAALARARARPLPLPAAWTREHARSFHVLELAALEEGALDGSDRLLATIPSRAWEALVRGDRIVLTPSSLLVAEHGPLGLAKLHVYSRAAWDAFVGRGPIALAERVPSALCARPASPDLCWQPRSTADRQRPALMFGTGASAAFVAIASLTVGLAFFKERRRLHADRIHVLRTLTHELRTPATSLRLDIEPLRAAYDELPAHCQEPLLRLSEGVERLQRVLHRSARYMALFETKAPSERLVKLREVASAREMFDEFSEEWPEGVTLVSVPPSSHGGRDGPLKTDPEWLGVAVRNLVENGVRHGKAPVTVSWSLEGETLTVRVADCGASPKLSLRRAIAPYDRDDNSPGLGLGLAIVDRVARLLGGRLSHEGSPTVFQLQVPS